MLRFYSDILETIFENLWIGDRVRLRLVCKTWNSILRQARMAIMAPWQILPPDHGEFEDFVKLESFLEQRTYMLKLPMLRGFSRCCGSSRGWLVMSSENLLNLWDPITGTVKELPPLSRSLSSGEIRRVEVFSPCPVDCVVAVLFGDKIAMCTPKENTWNSFHGNLFKKIQYVDILFHTGDGKLYALAIDRILSEDERWLFLSEKKEIRLTHCHVQVKPILMRNYDGHVSFSLRRGAVKLLRLVESSSTQNILVVVMLGGQEPTRLEVFRVCTGGELEKIGSIGEEAIFLGTLGSFSTPIVQGIEPDCIYLATDETFGYSPMITMCENGVFSLQDNKILQSSSVYVDGIHPVSRVGWFMPRFLKI